MKFGKLLQGFQGDNEAPEALLDYNRLKKKLKAFKKPNKEEGAGPKAGPPPQLAAEEQEFVRALNEDVGRINEFFMEREEEAVIKLKALEDRKAAAAEAGSGSELSAIAAALIDFHGEMVLLLHWSLVNYAAVSKLLKKHDKLCPTSLMRGPYLSNMLHQPFLSTKSISRLVRRAEQQVKQLSAGDPDEEEGGAGAERSTYGEPVGPRLPPPHPHIVKRTQAAMGMLQELQEKASTPSTLLPPGSGVLEGPPAKRQRVDAAGRTV